MGKRVRVLKKTVNQEEGTLTIAVIGTEFNETFDPKTLPPEIQSYLPVLALSHALGDSAAGQHGEDAVKAIQAKWQGYVDGKLTVRKPGEPKVSQTALLENFAKLSDEQKAAAAVLLESLGMTV